MSRPKSGREIVERAYKDLERMYDVQIENGELVSWTAADFPQRIYSSLTKAIQSLEKNVAKLQAPKRPRKKGARLEFEDLDP